MLWSYPFTHGLVLVFVAFVIGSYTDFRWRELPDWISHGMMYAGIGLHVLYSILTSSWHPVLLSLTGLFCAYLFGAFMYYAGQWGGGDTKALMGMGALLGFDITALQLQASTGSFLLVFLINSMIIGAFYGFFWSIVLAIIKWKMFFKAFIVQAKRYSWLVQSVGLLVLFTLVLYAFLPLLIRFLLLIFTSLALLYTFIVLFVKAVEVSCMHRHVTPEKLTEGDWIATEIILEQQVIPKEYLQKKMQAVLSREQSSDVLLKHLIFFFEVSGLQFFAQLAQRRRNRFSFARYYDHLLDEITMDVLLAEYSGVAKSFAYFSFVFKQQVRKALKKKIDAALSHDASWIAVHPISHLVDVLVEHNLFYDKIYVSGPKELGIEREHIQMLIDLKKKGKLETVEIKEGVPFIPSFLLALVFTLVWGNILLIWL